jgi:uncharacterized protein YegJ (DUF2314 family)
MWRGVLVASLITVGTPSAAQSVLDRARRDEVARVRTGDPAMAAAIEQARAGLDGFFAIADNPGANRRNFSVKVAVPTRDGHEYLWIRPFERNGDQFVGRVNNTPRNIANLKSGDRIAFQRKDIADWLYLEGDSMKGNYTACALLRNEPPEQRASFRRQYGLACAD